MSKKELWGYLVPQNDIDSTQRVQEFFACVAALMSIQLRSMVINSLADFLAFYQIHEVNVRRINCLINSDEGQIYSLVKLRKHITLHIVGLE